MNDGSGTLKRGRKEFEGENYWRREKYQAHVSAEQLKQHEIHEVSRRGKSRVMCDRVMDDVGSFWSFRLYNLSLLAYTRRFC